MSMRRPSLRSVLICAPAAGFSARGLCVRRRGIDEDAEAAAGDGAFGIEWRGAVPARATIAGVAVEDAAPCARRQDEAACARRRVGQDEDRRVFRPAGVQAYGESAVGGVVPVGGGRFAAVRPQPSSARRAASCARRLQPAADAQCR
ncbi:hypothetical protein C666_18940, partial [Thauera linaloolentis 47Lol = DSM 12138]